MGADNLKDAQSEAGRALVLSRQAAGETPHFEVALADARVKAKLGKPSEGRQQLESALFSAHKFGYRLYELQLRLALDEVKLQDGSQSARADLSALEADARANGAILVADQARTLRQSK